MGIYHDRMQQDLELHDRSPSTKREYLRCARAFVAHYMRPPTELGRDEIRRYLLHLKLVKRAGVPTRKMHFAAIRFLYMHTLRRPDVIPGRVFARLCPRFSAGPNLTLCLRQSIRLRIAP